MSSVIVCVRQMSVERARSMRGISAITKAHSLFVAASLKRLSRPYIGKGQRRPGERCIAVARLSSGWGRGITRPCCCMLRKRRAPRAVLRRWQAALLVAIGVKADGHKVVLAVSSGYRESTASWSGLLRELKARGMNEPRLVVGDGNLGLWSALRNVFPGVAEQRCWNHRVVNVLTQVPMQRQGEARELLTKIPYQRSERQARQRKRVFQNWCVGHGYERAAELIDENWEQMVTFYRFPSGHWLHLRTTNVVESPFAALRLRTDAAKRFKKVANATAVVWKMLLVAERKFRRINSPELLPAVAAGQQYHDGLPIRGGQHQEAAA